MRRHFFDCSGGLEILLGCFRLALKLLQFKMPRECPSGNGPFLLSGVLRLRRINPRVSTCDVRKRPKVEG